VTLPGLSSNPDRSRIAITGWGLVTPLGNSAWETFARLLAGRLISDRLAKLEPDLKPVDVAKAVGGVNIARHGPDPSIELAERAAREALFMADQQRPASSIEPGQTLWLMGSSKGAAHAFHAAADVHGGCYNPTTRLGAPPPKDAALAVALGPHGYLSHHLEKRLGVTGIRQIVAACASSLLALHHARQLLTQGPVDQRPSRVVVLTSEAALMELFIASYQRLGVLPSLTADADGQYHYRGLPLDDRRSGFLLAEFGAAVVLDRVENPAPGTIVLEDTQHAAEAFDLMRTDPAMPALSRVAQQLLTSPVDMIHAHATGTQDHDPAELDVYSRLLTRPTPVYAAKGALGHGLGAAGLVSTVLACLCAKTGRSLPMPWLESPITPLSSHVELHRQSQTGRALNRHAIFAAGFGGHVAGAVIQRV
jgi:3-oxoacyl-[acyl-carrier-protein] synthase II